MFVRAGRLALIAAAVGSFALGSSASAQDAKYPVDTVTLVTHSIREPGVYSSGAPIEENRAWRRNAARMRQLDAMARRIATLEKQLQALTKESQE